MQDGQGEQTRVRSGDTLGHQVDCPASPRRNGSRRRPMKKREKGRGFCRDPEVKYAIDAPRALNERSTMINRRCSFTLWLGAFLTMVDNMDVFFCSGRPQNAMLSQLALMAAPRFDFVAAACTHVDRRSRTSGTKRSS